MTRPTRWILPSAILLASMFAAPGCHQTQTLTSRPTDLNEAQRVVDEGYSLLHSLMLQQSNLDMILLVKSPSPPTRQLVRQIAELSRTVRAELEMWSQADPMLAMEGEGLPLIEQNVRAAMGNTSAQTLMAATGDNFELRLLLTQGSATEYAAALAKQLADFDDDEARRARLMEIAEQFTTLHRRVVTRLTLHPA